MNAIPNPLAIAFVARDPHADAPHADAPRRRVLLGVVLAHLVLVLAILAVRGGPNAQPSDAGSTRGATTFSVRFTTEGATERRARGVPDGVIAPHHPPLPEAPRAPVPPPRGAADAADVREVAGTGGQAPVTGTAGDAGAAASDVAPTDYRRRLGDHILRFHAYPGAARAAGLTGIVTVRIRINRDGGILDLRVVNSGNAILDAAAMQTIWRAAPLPAVPAALTVPWEVDVPLAFQPTAQR